MSPLGTLWAIFELLLDQLVQIHPPEQLRQAVDAAAAKAAQKLADAAEAVKFGPPQP